LEYVVFALENWLLKVRYLGSRKLVGKKISKGIKEKK